MEEADMPEDIDYPYPKTLNTRGYHWVGRDRKGYVLVTATPGHPRARGRLSKNAAGFVKRSVLVLEAKIGRYLLPSEHVHHINSIRDDDRPENLEAMDGREHCRLSQKSGGRKRVGAPSKGEECVYCHGVIKIAKRGLCNACYLKAKRLMYKTGEWPEWSKKFARVTGVLD